MNDKTPTSFDTVGDAPLEARIVSWVLGEASNFEAAELERLCEERPELLIFRHRMRALHGLLTEAEAAEPDLSWKLSPEKRKILDEIFGEDKATPIPSKNRSQIHYGRRALLAIAACLVISFVVFQLIPKKYEAQAIIEVKPPTLGLSPFGKTQSTTPFTPQFFGTEFERIKSNKSLEQVVTNLDLPQRWGVDQETALKRVKNSIKTENLRGTDLISVRVSDTNEQDAKDITHEIVQSYKAYRTEMANRDADRELRELNKAVQDQEDKVEEHRKLLATIVRTKGVIYKGQDSFYGQSGVDEDQGARTALQTFNELEQSKMQLESQINSLLKYDSDQLMTYAAGLDTPDNDIKGLLPQYQEAKREMKELSAQGLGNDHPTAKVKADELERMKTQLYEGVINMRATLQAQLEMATDRLKTVEVMKNSSREDAIKRGLDAQDYVDAKRDFESDQQLLQELRLKQVGASIALKTANDSIVIHEEPARSSTAGRRDQTLAVSKAKPASPLPPGQYPLEPKPRPAEMGSVQAKEQTQIAKQSAQRQIVAGASLEPSSSSLPQIAESSSITPMGSIVQPQLSQNANWSGLAEGEKTEASLSLAAADRLGEKDEGRPNDFGINPESMPYTLKSRGLRSGDEALNRQSIDAIVNNPNPLAANEKPSEKMKSFSVDTHSDAFLPKKGNGEAEAVPESESSILPARTHPALADKQAQNVDQIRRNLYAAEGNFNLGKYDDSKKAYNDVLQIDPYNVAARRGLERVATAKSDYYRAAYDHTRAELLSQVDSVWELSVPTDAASPPSEPDPQPIPPKEAQPLIDLIEETSTSETPYSTFSLNISDASFQIAKAALAKGERPDPTGIKPEQFYNAVDYGDPAPTVGEPVAATIEQSAHPVIPARNLVRVALRTASVGRSAIQPLRLTLLVDQSGSMVREDRRASMEHALSQLGVLLTRNDLVTVIGFSRTSRLLADGMTGDQATQLGNLVNQSASEGGTNLEEAMVLGGQLAERHYLADAQNRIVLFTDGAANLGDANPNRLAEQVKAFRQKGLAFDIAGIGADDLNDRLLSELARNGNGRYYVVGTEKNDTFARQLAGAFRPAAENVKVQVNFNPQRVKSYKLIGFEKDRLKTEDFRNDAVDAAELAVAEAGIAIYQVEPIAEGTGELGEVSVRFRDTDSREMVERTWTMHYDSAAPAFDRATPSMQLAGLSLLAAEKLGDGPLGAAIDFKQFSHSTSQVKEAYGSSSRVQDMLQVIDSLR